MSTLVVGILCCALIAFLVHGERESKRRSARVWEEGRSYGETTFIQCPDDNPYRKSS